MKQPAASRAASLICVAVLLASSACQKPPTNTNQPAPATEDSSWAVPIVERRIRAIVTRNYDEFLKTDVTYKREHERLQAAGLKGDAERELALRMQKQWESITHPNANAASANDNEYFFAFDKMQYTVDPDTHPIEGTADANNPSKQRVIVTCMFASQDKAPKAGRPNALKSAKIEYVATPHRVDQHSYGVRMVDGSEVYF